jgi:hypothetical protein
MSGEDRTGQVGLYHQTGFWPWVISTVTGSYWNHMVTGINATECASAQGNGVQRHQISDYPGMVWSEFPETQLARHKVAQFAADQLGKPYAYLDDFLIGIGLLTRSKTPTWILKRLRSGQRWECASLADAALQHGGVNVFTDGRPYGAVYPGSFEQVFRDYGWLPAADAEPPRWAPTRRRLRSAS